MSSWKNFCAIALLGAAFTGLGGCADLGPTHDPNWREKITSALPSSDATADFASAAEWFPDSKGFPDFAARMSGPENMRQGVFVLSPTALLFMSWDSQADKYTVMYRSAYTELQSSRVDAFGRNRRVVVTGIDFRQQAFGINGPNGAMVDRQATDQAAALLAARIPKK